MTVRVLKIRSKNVRGICLTNKGVAIAALLALSACQTAGSGGILGSVLPGSGDKKQEVAAVADPDASQSVPARPGQNPNARTRLINTQNSLSDYCPAVRIRAGTETFRVRPKGADKEDSSNVRYQATITKVARECAYVGQNLEIKVGAKGRAITGPSGQAGEFAMPIRVAVTEGGETIYSQLYRTKATISDGKTNTQFSFVDDKVVIPAPKRTNVRVFIGFDEGPYNTP